MEMVYKLPIQIIRYLNTWFDIIFTISIIGLYFYLAFKKGRSAMFKYFVMCLIWSSSCLWMNFLPSKINYLIGDYSPVHGYMITLGGMLYGIPLAILSFITWLSKSENRKKYTKAKSNTSNE